MLVYFIYFLGHLWPSLTKAKEAKIPKGDLALDFIINVSAIGIFVWDIFTKVVSIRGHSIWGAYVSIELSNITT